MILKDCRATLDLPAKPEALPRLTEWLENILEEISFPLRAGQQILICADEIAANIAAYAYPSGEGDLSVSVTFDAAAKELKISFSDCGVPFNPLSHDSPDTTVPVEQRQAGGVGILIVRRIMDQVSYCRDGDRNVLTIIKRSAEEDVPK